MAADQERADRIRSLKQDNPQLRWRHIADHVGVELRSAQMWQETGAISYDNAKRLATLFEGVDVDWIMRGPRDEAPSPFAGADDVGDQLAVIVARLDQIETLLQRVFNHRSDQGTDIITRLDSLERAISGRVDAVDDDLRRLGRAVVEGQPLEAPSDPPPIPSPPAAAAKKRAASPRTP